MNCLNLNAKVLHKGNEVTTQEIWDELTQVLGSKDSAYAVLSLNNGYPMAMTATGTPSVTHETLEKMTGDPVKADLFKATLYSLDFRGKFGDWVNFPEGLDVDANGEPVIHEVAGAFVYRGKTGNTLPVIPGNEYPHISFQNKSSIKDGVNFVFKQNKELSKIGNQQQYSQYLETIFPNSVVKDIMYHGSNTPIISFTNLGGNSRNYKDEFQIEDGIFFSRVKDGEAFSAEEYGNVYTPTILNIVNPELGTYYNTKIGRRVKPNSDAIMGSHIGLRESDTIEESLSGFNTSYQEADFNEWSNIVVVFNPKQTHILGSKQDIEGFKSFVGISFQNKSIPQISIIDFLKTNGLTSQQLGTSADTNTIYKFLLSKAHAFGITIDPSYDIPNSVEYVGESIPGYIGIGKSFTHLSQDKKAEYLMRALLHGVISREIQNMDTGKRNLFAAQLQSTLTYFNSFYTDPLLFEKDTYKLVDHLFNSSTLPDRMSSIALNSGRSVWDAIYHDLSSAMPYDIPTGLKGLFDSVLTKPKEGVKVVPTVVPLPEVLDDAKIQSYLDKLFIPDNKSSIKVGSIVKYSSKGMDNGFSYMVVTRIDSDGHYSAIAYDTKLLALRSNIRQVHNRPAAYFEKVGDYTLVEDQLMRATPIQIMVVSPTAIINITKLREGNPNFINAESVEDTKKYVERAVILGGYNSSPVTATPKTSEKVESLAKSPITYRGITYSSLIDAYIKLEGYYPITSSVTVKVGTEELLVDKKSALLQDLLYNQILQHPELNTTEGIYDLVGSPSAFITTKVNDFFMDSLKVASKQYDALVSTDTKSKLKYQNIAGVARGEVTSLSFGIPVDKVPVKIGDKVLIRDDANNKLLIQVSSIEATPTGSSIVFDLVDDRDLPLVMELNETQEIDMYLGTSLAHVMKDDTANIELVKTLMKQAIDLYTEPDGITTLSDLKSASTYYGNSTPTSAHALLVEALGDTPYTPSIMEAFIDLYYTLHAEPGPVEQDEKAPTENTFSPDDRIAVVVKSEEEFDKVMANVRKAIASGVKTFVTLKDADLLDKGLLSTKDILDYILSQGYKEVFVNGLRELHRIEKKSKAPAKKVIPIKSESIRTEVKPGTKNLKIVAIDPTDSRELEVGANQLHINFTKLTPTAFVNLLKANPGTSFKIDVVGDKVLEFLRAVKTEAIEYPDNLVLSPKLKAVLVLKEKAGTVSSQSKGFVTIKGVEINLNKIGIPYDLTQDQIRVLEEYAIWLENPYNKKPFSIEGSAGTGKTSLLRVAREYTEIKGISSTFSAMTHMAAINLEMLIAAKSSTLHSVLGIGPSLDPELGHELEFDSDMNTKGVDVKVLFIDEMSMASDKLTQSIIDTLSSQGIKVIFIGSKAQLPPVGNNENSIAFNEDHVNLHVLSEVKRQGAANPALPIYRRLSLGQKMGYTLRKFLHKDLFFNSVTKEGIYTFFGGERSHFSQAIVKEFTKSIKEDNVMGVRVLTYTNKGADSYNASIRKSLGYTEGPIMVGEYIFLTETTLSKDSRKGLPYKVTSVTINSGPLYEESNYNASTYTLTLEPGLNYSIAGEEGLKPVVITVVPPTADNISASKEYAQHLLNLRAKVKKHLPIPVQRKLIQEYLVARATYSFMEDVSGSVNGNPVTAIKRGFNYAYASTIHKAQGSTYDRIYTDEENVLSAIEAHKSKTPIEESYSKYNQLMYTALTRARFLSIIFTGRVAPTTTDQGDKALKDRLEEENTSGMFQNKGITMASGHVVTENSVEHRVRTVYDKLNETANDKVVSIAGIPNKTEKEEALFQAVPNDVLVVDPTNLEIVEANRVLQESLVSTGNPSMDRFHNQIAYDIYTNRIYSILNKGLTEEQIADDPDFVLQAKGLAVRRTLEIDIANLNQRASKLRAIDETLTPKQVEKNKTALFAVEDDIKQKQDQLRWAEEKMDIANLISIANSDLDMATKLLNGPEISHEDFLRIRNILNVWMSVGDFQRPDQNPYLNSYEAQEGLDGYRDTFKSFRDRASDLYHKLDKKGMGLTENDANQVLGMTIPKDALLKLRSSSNWFTEKFYSLAKVDNPILAYIMKLVNTANKKAEIQAISESKRLADAYKAMESERTGSESVDAIFWQRTKEGIPTGSLVHKTTYEYDQLKSKAHHVGEGFRREKIFKTFKEETVIIDPSRLTPAKIDAYRAELSVYFNPGEIDALFNEAISKWNEFVSQRDNYFLAVYHKPYSGHKTSADWTTEELEELKKWDKEHSPAARVIHYSKASSYLDIPSTMASDKFLVMVPKRFKLTAKKERVETGWYDKNYDTIQSKPAYKNFYEVAETITKRAKANFNDDYMSDYALGAVRRELVDEWKTHKIGSVTRKSLGDKIIKQFTGGFTTTETLDPITGERIKTLKKGIDTLEALIQEEYYRLKNERYPKSDTLSKNPQAKLKLYQEASNNIMKKDKGDIFMALNNLNMASLSYSYRSAIQPTVDVALHYAKEMTAGETRGLNAYAIKNKDIEAALRMAEHFINRELYSEGAPDESYKLPTNKIYTSEEREQKAKLEESIAILSQQEQTSATIKLIAQHKETIAAMGGHITAASILDGLVSYVRYLAIGWGFQAGLVNSLQGQMANVIMAASGKHYNYKDLKEAYSLMVYGPDREKFKNVVSNYALLGDIMYDFNKTSPFSKKKGVTGKAVDMIKPFYMTKITEKGNQGAIMIAMMLHSKVKNLKTGAEVSMWEAIDASGNLSDNFEFQGKTGSDAVAAHVQTITEQITQIHGDYINPKMIQNVPLGRAFIMFKLWFFDPLMVRFGSHKYNYILQTETKGRYITLLESLWTNKLNLAEIHRKYKKGELSAIDMDNMRTALAEGMAILSLMLAQLMAKWALCKEQPPKNCGKAQYAINTLNRLNQEMQTFITPGGYTGFIDNPLAVARVLKVMSALGGDLGDLLSGDDANKNTPLLRMTKRAAKETPLVRRIMLEKDLWTEDVDYN